LHHCQSGSSPAERVWHGQPAGASDAPASRPCYDGGILFEPAGWIGLGQEHMARVSKRFQVVIDPVARVGLGIRPGWFAVQTVVGDHLEMRFIPAEHSRSLAGSLNAYARGPVEDYAMEKESGWLAQVDAEWRPDGHAS